MWNRIQYGRSAIENRAVMLLLRAKFRHEQQLLQQARTLHEKRLSSNSQPLISITIATYNRADILVERTLPTVFEQTHQNFEVIIVGDHCTDNTAERITALNDSRVRFINLVERGNYPTNPKHRWMVAGTPPINLALQETKGDWIAHLDDDDSFEPTHLEEMLAFAQQNNFEMVYSKMNKQISPDEWVVLARRCPLRAATSRAQCRTPLHFSGGILNSLSLTLRRGVTTSLATSKCGCEWNLQAFAQAFTTRSPLRRRSAPTPHWLTKPPKIVSEHQPQAHAANEGNAVACVIVTYNASLWIRRCLESVLASSIPVDIIVVDNASSDDTTQIVSSFGVSVTLLAQSANLGFGRANNLGISYALQHAANYVFLLNQDTHVDPDAMGILVSTMRSASKYGILSPMHFKEERGAFDRRFRIYIEENSDQAYSSDSHWENERKTIYPVSYVNAAAWLLSREFLLKVGGFDPIFFMYGEDDDLCKRALRHGFTIGIVPRANIYHYRESSPASGGFFERLSAASQKPYSEIVFTLKQTAGFSGFLKRMAGELLKNGFGTLQLIISGRFRSALVTALALMRVLKNLPSIWQHRQQDRTTGAHWLNLTGSD